MEGVTGRTRRPPSFVGVVAICLMASLAVACSKSSSSSAKTNADKIKSAEEQYKAKNGVYGTQDQLVSAKLLTAPLADTDVILNSSGGKANSGFTVATGTVNVAANADQWVSSDSGSGPGYSSSAFVYP
jgi:hypothetical protein